MKNWIDGISLGVKASGRILYRWNLSVFFYFLTHNYNRVEAAYKINEQHDPRQSFERNCPAISWLAFLSSIS